MAVDWQQFYVPSTKQIGESSASVRAENAEKMRQAMLMAEQINQAQATTRAMPGSNTGIALGGTRPSTSIASGAYSFPGTGTGTGTGGGISYQVPGAGTVISNPVAGGGGTNILSTSLQEQYDPWSKYRGQAGTQLAGQMGQASPSDIYQQKLAQMATGEFSPDDPSYQFRFQEGQRAAERSLASRGLLGSGNAAIELQERGQQAASQEYGAQFNRMLQGLTGVESTYNTQIGRLMEMAGVNLDPTAGGKLAIGAGELGVSQGQLGINAQQVASNYDLGMRELVLKQQLAEQARADQGVGGMQGTDWSSIFGS